MRLKLNGNVYTTCTLMEHTSSHFYDLLHGDLEKKECVCVTAGIVEHNVLLSFDAMKRIPIIFK